VSQPKEQASNEYAGVTPPNVSALAALIRELDGKHNLGAGELAERLAARGVSVGPQDSGAPELPILLLSDTQCLKVVNAADRELSRYVDGKVTLDQGRASAATAFRDALLQALSMVRARRGASGAPNE